MKKYLVSADLDKIQIDSFCLVSEICHLMTLDNQYSNSGYFSDFDSEPGSVARLIQAKAYDFRERLETIFSFLDLISLSYEVLTSDSYYTGIRIFGKTYLLSSDDDDECFGCF